ncbi:MAG: hypothetical protein GY810_10685 [Aureispira sp.]|nr:hypothetical protein [Aureispira sp.]
MTQQLLLLVCLAIFCSCNTSQEENSVIQHTSDSTLVSEHPALDKENKDTSSDSKLLVLEGSGYKLLISECTKEAYNTAKQNKPKSILDSKKVHPKVKVLKKGCSLELPKGTIKIVENEEDLLMSVGYLGSLENSSICIFYKSYLESTIVNTIYNMNTGWSTSIPGTKLKVSPDSKFIFTLANDGIDWEGIALSEIVGDTVISIIETDARDEANPDWETLIFDPESAFWGSAVELFVSKGEYNRGSSGEVEYYKIEIKPSTVK